LNLWPLLWTLTRVNHAQLPSILAAHATLLARVFVLITASLAAVTAPAANYANPVLAGDYPDPSVIRVGDEYWATATTSEWAPLFPLLRSQDLVHWEHVGNVFQKRPEWAVANFWAPEISEHGGKFYMYYVGRRRGGPLSIAVATAPHPRGPWTDHGPLIGQPAGSIDADTIVDERGQRYLVWKEDGNSRNQPTPIWAQKLSEDGTQLVGEMTELLRNTTAWEKNLVEGPFLKRRGEYFYMFYSGNGCCGTGCNYALGVARSRQLLGPWEKNPANPILPANSSWRCPGHGSIVSTGDGRDYLLYHAYEANSFVYVGRQGLLDEVKWGPSTGSGQAADGWPTINAGQGPTVTAPLPVPHRRGPRAPAGLVDEFDSNVLKPHWQWPVNLEPQVQLRRGQLHLSSAPERGQELIGAVLALPTSAGDYTATTRVETGALQPGVYAGLSAFGDAANALGLSVGDGNLTLWRRQKNQQETKARVPLSGSRWLQLRLTATDGHKFHFSYSPNGRTWHEIGNAIDLKGDYLPPWDRGVRVAMVVGAATNAAATFDWLRLQNTRAR
jgi:beta-xylosidase